jgi:hypothetical protein
MSPSRRSSAEAPATPGGPSVRAGRLGFPLWGVGIDAAAHTGVALVRWQGEGKRPALAGLWGVFGTNPLTWHARLRLALEAIGREVGDAPVVAWIEAPPTVAGKNAFGGDRQGLRTAGGIGRRVGCVEARWMDVGLGARAPAIPLELREQPDWTAVLGRTRCASGKVGDGSNRLAEVAFCLDYGEERLRILRESESRSCVVDAAEGALIALAALLNGRGLRARDEIPSEARKRLTAAKRAAR